MKHDIYKSCKKRIKERINVLKMLKDKKFRTMEELEDEISKQVVWNRIQKKIKKGLKSKNRDAKELQSD